MSEMTNSFFPNLTFARKSVFDNLLGTKFLKIGLFEELNLRKPILLKTQFKEKLSIKVLIKNMHKGAFTLANFARDFALG